MGCNVIDFKIAFDNTGRIARAINGATGVSRKDRTTVAFFVNSNPAEFTQWIYDNYSGAKKAMDAKGIKSNDFTRLHEINTNTLVAAVKRFANFRIPSIEATMSVSESSILDGFSSLNAKTLGIEDVGNKLLDLMKEDAKRPKTKQMTNEQLIKAVIGQVRRELQTRIELLIADVIAIDPSTGSSLKSTLENFSARLKEYQDSKRAADENFYAMKQEYEWLDYRTKSKKITSEESAKERKELDDRTREFDNDSKKYKKLVNDTFNELINFYISTIKQYSKPDITSAWEETNNFLAEYMHVKAQTDNIFEQLFSTKKFVNYAKKFKNIDVANAAFENSDEEIDGFVDSASENIDETTKNWEDSIAKTYLNNFSTKTKLYFDTLYTLAAPIYNTDSVISYDTDNEVGVKTTKGANYYITQIESIVAGAISYEDFISKLQAAGEKKKHLYSLTKVVQDMRQNPVLGNYLYSQLKKYKVNKSMITINPDNYRFARSNENTDASTEIFYNMFNILRGTINPSFEITDANILENVFKVALTYQSGTSLILQEEKVINALLEVNGYLTKYFPNIDGDIAERYIRSRKDSGKAFLEIASLLKDFNYRVGAFKEAQNKLHSEYVTKWIAYRKERDDGNTKVAEPVKGYATVEFNAISDFVRGLSDKFIEVSQANVELNSINGENNLSSDLINDSWLSMWDTLPQYVEKEVVSDPIFGDREIEVQEGFNSLYDRFGRQESTKYNSILFGVTDRKGILLTQGIFNRHNVDNPEFTKEIKNKFGITLFNGTRVPSLNSGNVYDKMGRSDYFITQLLAYKQSFDSRTRQEDRGKFGSYFLQVPSDAPKNFLITANKFAGKLFIPDQVSVEENLARVKNNITGLSTNGQEFFDKDASMIAFDPTKYSRNVYTMQEIYDILYNENERELNVSEKDVIKTKNNDFILPVIHRNEEGQKDFVIYVRGNKNNKNKFTINKIEAIRTLDEAPASVNFMVALREPAILSRWTEDNIAAGRIQTSLDRNAPIFVAYTQLVKQELNNFITNLNNVMEVDSKGRIVSKTSVDGLFEFAHHVGGKIVNNGKFTGNLFNFIKLFNTNGFNGANTIINMLSLYGDAGIFKQDSNGNLAFNEKHAQKFIRKNRFTTSSNNNIFEFAETNEVLDIIENFTEQWLTAYSREIIDEYNKYSDIIPDDIAQDTGMTTFEFVQEAILNANLFQMNVDELTNGSLAFYKNPQTYLKRAKESQAGGQVNAAMNFARRVSLANINDVTDSGQTIWLNEKLGVKSRAGFVGMTITNTIRPFDAIEDLDDALATSGISEERRKEILKPFRGNTTTNDAISYITLDEFIRRTIYEGTFDDYADLFVQLTDPNIPVEKLNLEDIIGRIQLQKHFYYDMGYDEKTKTNYPRQIKNAEFVLIPKLLEKNSSLMKLHELMEKYGINQINTAETDKAAKRFVGTYWDNDGVAHPEEFEKQLQNTSNYEVYEYSFLYKQQDTPNHIQDEHNKLGTQISKKIYDNIDPNGPLGEVSRNLQLYTAQNVEDDYKSLLYRLGFEQDEHGELINRDIDTIGMTEEEAYNARHILNFNEFYKRARIEAQRLGLDSNFIEALTPDNYGNTVIPNWNNNISTKIESIAQSIFNSSVARQTLPGWHGAQMTQVGYSSRLKLRYHPNGQAIVEVLLPRWSKLLPQRPKKGQTQEEFDKELLAKLEKEGLDLHIGYRIPTEGKQSVAVLKVVGFLDETYGSTIVVPDAWVTQTGSDFDIDSIYGMNYEFFVDKSGDIHKYKFDVSTPEKNYIRKIKETLENQNTREDYKVIKKELQDLVKSQKGNIDIKPYEVIAKKLKYLSYSDYTKLPVEGQMTRHERNNAILDSYITIMRHPSSLEENLTVSGFDDLTAGKEKYDPYVGNDYSKVSPYNYFTQLKFFENAISGRAIKAFSVNRDTFNSINNVVRPYLNDKHIIKIDYGNGIEIHDKIGWSENNRNKAGKLLTPYSSQTTSHILDAMKIGTLYNENMYTFGVFKTLIDVGVDYDTAIAFLYQPAITKINDNYFKGQSLYSSNNTNPIHAAIKDYARQLGITIDGEPITPYTKIDSVITALSLNNNVKNALKNDFGIDLSEENWKDDTNYYFNKNKAVERLKSSADTQDWIYFDLGMALLFNKYKNTTLLLEKMAGLVRPDSFGAKQTIFETRLIVDKIDEAKSNFKDPLHNLLYTVKTIVNEETNKEETKVIPYLDVVYPSQIKDSAYPYIAAMYEYATKASVNLNKRLFLFEGDAMTEVVKKAQYKLGIKFTPEQYLEFKKYIVTSIYNKVPRLLKPITINSSGFIEDDLRRIKNVDYEQTEYKRILGLEELAEDIPYISDMENITEEDIAAFNMLTPLQKVNYIQQYFNNSNKDTIFKYLYTSKFNPTELQKNGYSRNRITFRDNNINIEQLFILWNKAFMNNNPLVRLTMLDLVKYAYIAEGNNFKKGSISKLVTNKSVYLNTENKGFDLITPARTIAEKITKYENFVEEEFLEKYVRSHTNVLPTYRVNQKQDKTLYAQLLPQANKYGLIFIPFTGSYANTLDFFGLNEKEDKAKDYINITFIPVKGSKRTTLYRVVRDKLADGIYLVPLNLLDQNETFNVSMNNTNIKDYILDTKYYEAIIAGKVFETTEEIEQFKIQRYKYKRNIDAGNENYFLDRANGIIPVSKTEKAQLVNIIQKISTTLANDSGIYDKSLVFSAVPAFNNFLYGKSEGVVQNIIVNGTTVSVLIKPYGNKRFKQMMQGKNKAFTKQEQPIVEEIKNSQIVNPRIYSVEIITEEEIKNANLNPHKDITDGLAEDLSIVGEIRNTGKIDRKSKEFSNEVQTLYDILGDIYIDRRNEYTKENAETVISILNQRNVNYNSLKSIDYNKTSIYQISAEYYKTKAQKLKDAINNFYVTDDEVYDISAPEVYEYLKKNPEEFDRLLHIILQAKTFGGRIKDIFSLDLKGEDPVTDAAIKSIQDTINSIKNDAKVTKAIDYIYNHYLAELYSTNPNIVIGLTDIRDVWGDSDFWDRNISDINDLAHKQIQLVTKLVNSKLQQSRFDGFENVRKHKEKMDELMKLEGSFSWGNIIDKDGKFVRAFTEDFITKRNELNYQVDLATKEYYLTLAGNDRKAIIDAKLNEIRKKYERDIWRHKNVEQQLVSTYYEEKLANTEKILAEAPIEFATQSYLIDMLNRNSKEAAYLTDSERTERDALKQELQALTNIFNEDGTRKPKEVRDRIEALRQYNSENTRIKEQYYTFNDLEEFQSALQTNLNILKQFEESNPDLSFEERMTNDEYAEAYNWIKDNAIYKLAETSKQEIAKIQKDLYDEDLDDTENTTNEISVVINELPVEGRYDINGKIIGTRYSKEQINKIREATEKKYADASATSSTGLPLDFSLIKNTPKNLPIFSKEFYDEVYKTKTNVSPEDKQKERELITKINNLIKLCLDDAGNISSELVFKLAEEQQEELAQAYKDLRYLRSEMYEIESTEEEIKETTKVYKRSVNQDAYDNEYAWYLNNVKTDKQRKIWRAIFIDLDVRDGLPAENRDGIYIPNRLIYSYIRPLKKKDGTWARPEYINQKKTNAKKFFDDNFEYITTQYYEDSQKQAFKDGRYEEWFAENHVYNPFTRQFEPLKIWTTRVPKPGSKFINDYSYIPKGDKYRAKPKEESLNKNYKERTTNYNSTTGNYNNTAYNSLSSKEKAVSTYLQDMIKNSVHNDKLATYFAQGYAPRKGKIIVDKAWIAKQAIGTVGIALNNYEDREWYDEISYFTDRDADFDMARILKAKGYKNEEPLPKQDIFETDLDYAKRLQEVKEKNAEIRKANLELERNIREDDWIKVFEEFVNRVTEYNARESTKNILYLTLEDLKDNPAFAINKWGKIKKTKSPIEHQNYQTVSQDNTFNLLQDWSRRVIFEQFKQPAPGVQFADIMQNITSAKYMILNLTGGIANVTTGFTNMIGEQFAGDFFSKKEFWRAIAQYNQALPSILANMYSDTANNFYAALTKYFEVVNLDEMTERKPGEGVAEYTKRVQNWLYGMQSGGEHMMQNIILFAMLNSHRIYTDAYGKTTIGSFNDYIRDIEINIFRSLLQENGDYGVQFDYFFSNIKKDKDILKKYDTLRRNLIKDFINTIEDATERKRITDIYLARKKEVIKQAKVDFNNLPVLVDQFTNNSEGKITVKEDSVLNTNLIGQFKNKVLNVNKLIHGVYDKLGAAAIEKHWWGSLVMQYHKHLYPGIMKRFRTKGYYNENLESWRKGSYISAFDFITTEFKEALDKLKTDKKNGETITVLKSVKTMLQAAVDTGINLKFNWQMLSEFEKMNVQRTLGDLCGMASAMLMAFAIYLMTDDDDRKNSNTIGTLIYLSDRLFSESQQYTPWGMIAEARTLWSSPIAAQNSFVDLFKAINITYNMLFDDEFDPYYKTGLYAHQHKLTTIALRNIPGYRVYNRLQNMARNNQYYRIDESSINIGLAANLAESLKD